MTRSGPTVQLQTISARSLGDATPGTTGKLGSNPLAEARPQGAPAATLSIVQEAAVKTLLGLLVVSSRDVRHSGFL